MSDTDDIEDINKVSEVTSDRDFHDFEKQLGLNLASLLQKMQTVLHIPESAEQDVVQQLWQINQLSKPLLQHSQDCIKQI